MVSPRTHTQVVDVSGVTLVSGQIPTTAAGGGGVASDVSVAGVAISGGKIAVTSPAAAGVAVSNPVVSGGVDITNISGDVHVTGGNSPLAVSAAAGAWPVGQRTDAIYVSSNPTAPAFAAITTQASAGNHQVVAAASGKAIRVLNYSLISPGTVEAYFRSSTGGAALTGGLNLARGTNFPNSGPYGLFETETSHALTLQVGAAVSVGGHLTYVHV